MQIFAYSRKNAYLTVVAAVFFSIILVSSTGCLKTPTPLNETGFLRKPQNQSEQIAGSEGFDFGGGIPTNPNDLVLNYECVMNGTGGMGNIRTFMKGRPQDLTLRTEYYNGSKTIVSIVRGGRYFVSAGIAGTPFENCSWLEISAGAANGSDGQAYNATNYTQSPYGGYGIDMESPACFAGNFSDDIFETPGRICDMNGILGGKTNGFNLSQSNQS